MQMAIPDRQELERVLAMLATVRSAPQLSTVRLAPQVAIGGTHLAPRCPGCNDEYDPANRSAAPVPTVRALGAHYPNAQLAEHAPPKVATTGGTHSAAPVPTVPLGV